MDFDGLASFFKWTLIMGIALIATTIIDVGTAIYLAVNQGAQCNAGF